MQERLLNTLLIVLLSFALSSALAAPQNPDAERITPDEARRALSVLEQDDQRAEVVHTLKVIASEAPQAAADAPDSTAEALLEDAPAETNVPLGSAIVPLEADGLIAQALRQIGRWADGLGQQVNLLKQAMLELPQWFQETFDSEAGRAFAGQILLALSVVFALGWCAEWVGSRVLRRPRRVLLAHAEDVEARTQKEEAQRRTKDAPTVQLSDAQVASNARIRPENDSVALLQTMRNGVEHIEVIPLGGTPLSSANTDQPAIGTPGTPAPDAGEARTATKATTESGESAWSALRHLPYAIGALVLDLLPLVLFFFAAGMVLHLLPGIELRTRVVTSEFVNAYIISRVAMAVVRLLVSPAGYGLQVLRFSRSASGVLHFWMRCFVVLTTFGIAFADAIQLMGAGVAGRVVIVKFISLLVHIGVLILIFQMRRPVAAMIAAPDQASGPLASMRNWLAKIWALLAAVLVAGLWVIWALGIENGFPRLMTFIGVSGAIIVLGRLAAVLALGALARVVRSEASIDAAVDGKVGEGDVRSRLTEQYYPFIRRLVSFVIAACTFVVLLQAWGLNAIGWFAPGTIGGSITSAALTIMVAVAIAVVVWQTANVSLQRRIRRWNEQGEKMRAARLSTLLPMLRSILFLIIALVVGLTALSELGINTTPLLAGASIVGVAVGFGSQKLVQDFITGIFLLMENTMQVGDGVTVAGVSGTVENLSIRTVRLRAGDGSLHIVPFSSVSTVNNTNRGIGNAAVRIGVGFDTDIEQAIAELKDIGAQLRQDPAFQDLIISDLAVWGVDAVDGSMVTLAGQMSCIDKGRWGVQREINRRILERFRELGIQIADPRERPMLMPEGNAGPGS